MEIIFTCFILLYCTVVVFFHYHWLQIPRFCRRCDFVIEELSVPELSIIIPVRNEAPRIGALLTDLELQRLNADRMLPSHCWEVIIVDDHSEDDTLSVIRRFQESSSLPLKILTSQYIKGSHQSPKKKALWCGIGRARGKTIVTTDGDCRVGPYWVINWMQFFRTHPAVFAAGSVAFHEEVSRFEQWQSIEFASLIGVGGASIQCNRPITCNGANLAFSRQAFLRINGYQDHWHIPSGDDEFLLHAMARHFPEQIYFVKTPEIVVRTSAKLGIGDFIQQRKRWAGKWRMHNLGWISLVTLLGFGCHLSIILAGAYSLLNPVNLFWLIALLFLKMSLEFIFVHSVFRSLKKKLQPLNFLTLQMIYSAYFVLIGILASTGGYTWKDRKYSRHD